MITIAQLVEQYLNEEPFMLELIQKNLINLSSLAREFQPRIEKKFGKAVKLGSIVVALNRLAPQIQFKTRRLERKSQLNFMDITVRSNLNDYTFENSSTLINAQKKLLKALSEMKGIFYTVSRGVLETTVVISQTCSTILEECFKDENLISIKKELSSITVKLPASNTETPGLYYLIFKKIAWNEINIDEVISTTNEITLLVKDEKVGEVFSILKNFNSTMV